MTATLTQKRIRMSRQEFDQLPEGPPYYDYIQGEAIEVNRPTGEHQEIVVWLASKLWEYTRQNGLGRVWSDINVDLPTGELVGPDVVYLATENLHLYSRGYIQGVPDLVGEVLSPSNASYDRVDKLDAYRRAGVPWVWLIDPDTLVVEEYQWTPEGYLLVSTTPPTRPFEPKRFAGLKLDLGATFATDRDSSLRSE
ncbi:MAG: Uma2 family endonuclease [Fimbriimonadales bacterium]|nr:Uma2 family endonuclease [Fimbriimonadales bacterium]